MENIHLFHLNDLHSHLNTWPPIVSFINKKRNETEEVGGTSFVFDLGDAVDRVHPLMEATDGQAMTRLLNKLHVDAVTIGNNEGIGSTKEILNHLYDEAQFPIILSNLIDAKTGNPPKWVRAFHLLKTKEGQKIGLFAVTVPLNMSYMPLGWHVEDPFDSISQMLELYAEFADTHILLSHMGLAFDREVAKLHPELDVIIGAHTHHLLPNGERVGDTLIAAAGKFGEYVGEIKLEMENGSVRTSKAYVHSTASFPIRHEEQSESIQYEELGRQLLTEVEIARLDQTFEIQWNACSECVHLALQAICEYAHTEASMLNAGLFMRPLLEGIVTQNDLHESMPHPMRIVRVTLKGDELIAFLKDVQIKKTHLQDKQVSGIGFRGKILGKICFSGIKFEDTTHTWLWKNEPIDLDIFYTLATVDHFVFADYFPILKNNADNEILFPYFLRDVIGQYVKKHFPL